MFKRIVYADHVHGIYPEREESRTGKIEPWLTSVAGFLASRFPPRHKTFAWITDAVLAHEKTVSGFSDEHIRRQSLNLRPCLRKEGFTRERVANAFALVREAAGRHLGTPHFKAQLIGGYVLLSGMTAEMETGEGKTLTATLPACVLALAGIPVHIITVNDYLAARDADWMRPVYQAMGLTVGTVVQGMDHGARRDAYQCDVTYCTNKEVAFDYLRDRIVLWDRPTPLRLKVERLFGEASRIPQLVMRGLHFAIVDEADSVLIDEARTPLIISSEAGGLDHPDVYRHAMNIAGSMAFPKDFVILEGDRKIELTRAGKSLAEEFDWTNLPVSTNREQRVQLVRQGLTALHIFKPDKHYLVRDGKVQIIDEYTGRVMADRSWEMGLHQLIEIKEGCEPTLQKQTRARISYQRFFRRYLGLAGMTGTAREVAGELWSVYRMRVVSIPTNRPIKREHYPDRIYVTEEKKWEAVVDTIAHMQQQARPSLIGTRSVEASDHLSGLLKKQGLAHTVLNARQDEAEADVISKAGQAGQITVATNMAGRGTDIRLAPGVAQLGGLYVMATERHESSRIDRQLFGRCARQGDPGACEALVSLDDELIKVYVNKGLCRLAAFALSRRECAVTRWMGSMIFRIAQASAGRLHSRMRRNLSKMDEQIGESLAFSGRFE